MPSPPSHPGPASIAPLELEEPVDELELTVPEDELRELALLPEDPEPSSEPDEVPVLDPKLAAGDPLLLEALLEIAAEDEAVER